MMPHQTGAGDHAVYGSNTTGCNGFAERELRQNLLTTPSLAKITHADEAERRRLGNLALLTCPIGRELSKDEAEIYVESVRPLRQQECVFQRDDLRFSTDLTMSNGVPIKDLPSTCIVLKDAYVSPRGYVCADNRLYLESAQFVLPHWESGNSDNWFYKLLPFQAFDPKTRTAIFRFESSTFRAENAFVFSSSNSTVNFGHFIHDLLILVPMYKAARSMFPGLVALVHEQFKYPMQKFIFQEILRDEITNGQVFVGEVHGVYGSVLVPDLQFGYEEDELNVSAVQEVRTMLQELAAKQMTHGRSERHRKIFVSRKDGTSNAYNRAGLDHSRLEAIFCEKGYESISVSELKPEEVMALFLEAEVVAGVHGAGLMNVMFSRCEAPKLIELDPFNAGWTSIERFVRASGIEHKRLRAFDEHGHVDEQAVLSILEN